MPVSIVFNQILANSIDQNGSINSGQNNLADWTFIGKVNHGNGLTVGIISNIGNLTNLVDTDGFDMPVNNQEFINPQPNVQF
ncbi:MAG: hypothetical protein ACI35O_13500 [Bacillaceae bacterium]